MEQSTKSRRRGTSAAGAPETGTAQDQAQDKAKEVAGKAQEGAREAKGQARERLREQVDQRSTQAGEQVRSAAGDARSVADELRKQGKDVPARYAEQAADRAERLGDYLHQSDGGRILRDVEDFARDKPWAVAAAGLALGFAASRLLKASSTERYRTSEHHRSSDVTGAPPALQTSAGTIGSTGTVPEPEWRP